MPTSDDLAVAPLLGRDLLVGIFVGGESRRMGTAKGLLRTPEGTEVLVERAWRVISEALPEASRTLVGVRDDYAHLGYPTLADAAVESGPLGGLVALLDAAEGAGRRAVVAVACDLPYFSADLLCRLALGPFSAKVVAPYLEGRYQPLFARYAVELRLPFRQALESRLLALQPLLRQARADTFPLLPGEAEQLEDWDRPEDVPTA